MALTFDDATFRREKIGMPPEHAEKFSEIARDQQVVIISRAPGPTAEQLLREGYDTKGFRIHGKSCDWGPMAGFVLRDPRLNKKGDAAFNTKAHKESFEDTDHAGWRASTVPLQIYPERLDWLIRERKISIEQDPAHKSIFNGIATHSSGVSFRYKLLKERADSNGQPVYGVYVEADFRQQIAPTRLRLYQPIRGYQELYAMTNPSTHRSWPGNDFRNAITGDYDLFAVWPKAYDASMDKRILGTSKVLTNSALIDQREHQFTSVGGHHQGTKIGNITNRIYEISQYLNSAIGATSDPTELAHGGPFPNRNVCWHSDESARPGVDDVDVPLLAFTMTGLEVGIETIFDFEVFVEYCVSRGYYVTLAEGWVLDPTDKKKNRLGSRFAHLVPDGVEDPFTIPAWFNS